VTLKLHKELVNMTDSLEPEFKDQTNVADDVGDLLVKEEHVDSVEIPLIGWAPRNINSKRSKVVHENKGLDAFRLPELWLDNVSAG
jgi:hypothetical protein